METQGKTDLTVHTIVDAQNNFEQICSKLRDKTGVLEKIEASEGVLRDISGGVAVGDL